MVHSLYLIGARGAGKTSVGKPLAGRLGYRFVDSDDLVCRRAGSSIAGIVERYGWHGFRRLEEMVLRECSAMTRTVVATGGGAVLHEQLWQDIRACGVVIWLKAPVETLIDRVAADGKSPGSRPSLTGAGTLAEYREVLRERTPLYARAAHHIIETASLDRERVVADIVRVIGA